MYKQKKHFVFVDWMKVIGMYAIILGHFAPPILQYITYSFSVQLFFFISGFLFHKENDNRVFWEKNLRLLIIPYLIWGILRLITYNIKECNFQILVHSFSGLILGCNNFWGARGCGELWFVVTLLCLKFFSQYVGVSYTRIGIITILSLLLALFYRLEIRSTVIEFYGIGLFDSFVAYPYFSLGIIASKFKNKICVMADFSGQHAKFLCFIVFIVFVTLVYIAPINGVVYMVYGQYGYNILLFVLFGIIGIISVFLISLVMSKLIRLAKYAKIINVGSIMILGLHTLFVNKIKILLENFAGDNMLLYEMSLVLASFIILLAFVPLIKITNKYFPIAIGKR